MDISQVVLAHARFARGNSGVMQNTLSTEGFWPAIPIFEQVPP